MKKLLTSVFIFLFMSVAQASLSKDECLGAAQEVYAAQNVLNADKALFDMVTSKIKDTPAEAMGVSQEFKDFVLGLVSKLKAGGDPETAAKAAHQGCLAKLKAI